MMKILLLVSMYFIAYSAYSQEKSATKIENVNTKNLSFEEFVNQNAITVFSESSLKSSKFLEIEVFVEKPLLSDLKITALEEKAQYFKIKGTNKVLKIESLYRLRLMYQSQKK
jgi:hypothetical protein